MAKFIISRLTNGTIGVFTQREWNGYIILMVILALISFIFAAIIWAYLTITTLFRNVSDIDLLNTWNSELYFSNIINFHEGHECLYLANTPDLPPEPVYRAPFEIEQNPWKDVEGMDEKEGEEPHYPSMIVGYIEQPIMVKLNGFVEREYPYETAQNVGVRTVRWNAVSFNDGDQLIKGYRIEDYRYYGKYTISAGTKDIGYWCREKYSTDSCSGPGTSLDRAFIKDYGIGDILLGNRNQVDLSSDCKIDIVERKR
jgi:hypothetical protein